MNVQEKQDKFLELYEPSRKGLVKFAKAMTRDREETLDLVQETILKAYDSFENLKDPKAFKSYLFTIASRIYKRQLWRKRLFFSSKSSDSPEFDFENIIEPNNNPEILYDIKALEKALLKLPEKQREAIVLFELVGFSLPEIHKIQGGSLAGIKSRVQRARQKLEKILGVNKKPLNLDLVIDNKAITGVYLRNDHLNTFNYNKDFLAEVQNEYL